MISDIVDYHWDAIVIGTGIGGGTIGRRMAEMGLSVLFLERGQSGGRGETNSMDGGPDEPVKQHAMGDWLGQITGEVAGKQVSLRHLVWSAVGGISVFYAAALERPEPSDIDHSELRPHPTKGWPISYAALAPYLEQAEHLFHVCGDADPLALTPWETPYPAPAMGAGDAVMAERFRKLGLNPYRTHVGIRYLPGCSECLGRKCPLPCKMDGRSAGVEPALATGRAAILDNCTVTALRGNANRVTHVEVRRGGQNIQLRAHRIVLAAGGFGTPALLLHSASEHWPNGCANGSGLVGRNLMFHLSERVAIWPKRRTQFAGPAKAVSLRDFYHSGGNRFGLFQSMGLVAGYGDVVQSLNARFDSSSLRSMRPIRELSRVPALAATMIRGEARVFVGILEDMPYPENRVTINKADVGSIQFQYSFGEELNERRLSFRRMIKAGLRGQPSLFLNTEPELNFPHACGTARFGVEEATSVLDPSCRAHSVENLYVVDSSFMPTSNGVNPSLTIAANALRVADRLAEDFGQGAPRQEMAVV